MNLLTKEQFVSNKKKDGLAIIGSGYSINAIEHGKWNRIYADYDTFGMNWCCKLGRKMTWYLVREQAATPKRIGPLQTLDDFVKDMSNLNATLVVKDMSYQPNNYVHAHHTDKFNHDGMVFREIPGKCTAKVFRHDIFDEGIHHGKNTMTDALHFAVGMGYKEILFVGVDLYDSRYFWLPYDTPSPMVQKEGRSCNDPHLAAGNTIKIVRDTAETWGIKMYVENPKSLLAEHAEVWR